MSVPTQEIDLSCICMLCLVRVHISNGPVNDENNKSFGIKTEYTQRVVVQYDIF